MPCLGRNTVTVIAKQIYVNGFCSAGSAQAPTVSAKPDSEVAAFQNLQPQENDAAQALILPGSGLSLQSGTCWLSVQPNRSWYEDGPWYWLQESSSDGAMFRWRNPENGFGVYCADWRPANQCSDNPNPNYDLAFQIRGAALKILTVTLGAGAGSKVLPDTPQTVNEGSTTMFKVVPHNGYLINTVGASCGGSMLGNDRFRTDPVTQNCRVTASFKIDSDTTSRMSLRCNRKQQLPSLQTGLQPSPVFL